MTPEEFRAAGHQAIDWIADYLRDAGNFPVLPNVKPGDITALLPRSAPEQGEPIEKIFEDFRDIIVPGIVHWNHPRFFAYFANSASGPGILGELFAAALNDNHMLWKTGPSATELEQVSLSWVRQWMGLPDNFFGIIHDTASTATMHAILAARAAASADISSLVLYTSEHANLSVDRAALAAGISRSHIRHIPADDEFRMRPDALEAAIEADLAAGLHPFCVVPTLGTTSTASLDPLLEIAAIAQRHKLWLHVDAAYAGPAAILEEHRAILHGAEQADSLVVNPHKWLFTPMDLSILYTARPEAFRSALSLQETPVYIQTAATGSEVNLCEYTVSLGRRFRALKLWFVLRSYGREGVTKILRSHIEMARHFADQIEASENFELAARVQFSLVCFRLRGTDQQNLDLLNRVNATGRVFLSSTVLKGRVVLRLAIGNIATTPADVEEAWQLLSGFATLREST